MKQRHRRNIFLLSVDYYLCDSFSNFSKIHWENYKSANEKGGGGKEIAFASRGTTRIFRDGAATEFKSSRVCG